MARGHWHVRDWPAEAEHGPPLVLVHWTPLSGRMWEPLPRCLRGRRRVIVPDLLGYGMSVPPAAEWSVEDWAADVVGLLKALDVAEADVLGGHAGAAGGRRGGAAGACAGAAGVVDGVPLMTPELRAAFAGLSAQRGRGRRAPRRWPGRGRWGCCGNYPGFSVTDANIDTVWTTMRDYLATDFVSSGR
jgi:pimeloyl-ACP methyl ester carboxylesterase